VILDLDETVLDNSLYEVWLMKNDQSFSNKSWNAFVATRPHCRSGRVEFAKYADSKGVKVFYITNRGVEVEADTRQNMDRYGFPMGGNVDTFLMQGEKPDWASAKGTRRAVITTGYRVLLNIGDNFGDFDDSYRSNEDDRLKAFEANRSAGAANG